MKSSRGAHTACSPAPINESFERAICVCVAACCFCCDSVTWAGVLTPYANECLVCHVCLVNRMRDSTQFNDKDLMLCDLCERDLGSGQIAHISWDGRLDEVLFFSLSLTPSESFPPLLSHFHPILFPLSDSLSTSGKSHGVAVQRLPLISCKLTGIISPLSK